MEGFDTEEQVFRDVKPLPKEALLERTVGFVHLAVGLLLTFLRSADIRTIDILKIIAQANETVGALEQYEELVVDIGQHVGNLLVDPSKTDLMFKRFLG